MAIPALLEHHIGLSLVAALEDLALGLPIQVQGHRDPILASVEDWLAVDVMSIRRRRTRRGVWRGVVYFQVTCISRLGMLRVDKDANAPWGLAAQVRAGIEKVDLVVRDYDASGDPQVATMLVAEADATYGTDGEGQGDAKGSGTHYVRLVFHGEVTANYGRMWHGKREKPDAR